MRLLNGHRAVVAVEKLTSYCLNLSHPRGRHKAKVFNDKLRLTIKDALYLRWALLGAAQNNEVVLANVDKYGKRYSLDFAMEGPLGMVTIRSSWIILKNEDFPRFVSCYILLRGRKP